MAPPAGGLLGWISRQVRIAWLYLLFIAGSQIFVILAITAAAPENAGMVLGAGGGEWGMGT